MIVPVSGELDVSLHKSLVSGNKMARARSVLTRAERIERLTEEGRFTEGETSVFGLPKVRTIVKAKKKKKKTKDDEETITDEIIE
jgi:small basic protein (TIGR04137 family)